MPFIGKLDDRLVYPGAVSDSTCVRCPECGGEMYVRGGPNTERLRHFVHFSSTRECRHESVTHQKWKQRVFRSLRELELADDTFLFFGLEGEVDVSETPSVAEKRQSDVLIKFADQRDQFGKGIAVEVQYRNDDKDSQTVTYDYLASGYSVRWVTRRDFTSGGFDAAEMIAESDATRLFFRHGSTSLPSFDTVRECEFKEFVDLFDAKQQRISAYSR